MLKKILFLFLVATALTLTSCGTEKKDVTLDDALVSTEWLQENLNNKNVVVLDVRTAKNNYREKFKYIPNSRLWDWSYVRFERELDHYEKGGSDKIKIIKLIPTKAEFEKVMSDLGVGNDDIVIITATFDTTKTMTLATRAYWTLKYFGHKNVAVLDGGDVKWIAENRETVDKPVKPQSSNYKVQSINKEIRATTEQVHNAISDENTVIVDARTSDYYSGEKMKDYVYKEGHIKSAINIPHPLIMDEKDNTFKSSNEYKKLFEEKGLSMDKTTIYYCDSGHISTGLWFIMTEIMGNKKAKQYDGSAHEWTKYDSLKELTVQ